MSPLAQRIEAVQFTPVRLREGYDMGEVDQLLDRLVAAIEQGEPLRPLVSAARFTPVRLREGYDMGEVDQFLDAVVADSESGVAAAPPPPPQDPASRIAEPRPDVIQEQRGLLSRLFGKD